MKYLHNLELNEQLHLLADTTTIHEKYQIAASNSINIQYAYFENIPSYDIDIKTRLSFSEAMINCDRFNTVSYKSQNWEFSDYITFCCIKSSNILPSIKPNIKKSTIWSNYSNFCSKQNKILSMYINESFFYSYNRLKYVQY